MIEKEIGQRIRELREERKLSLRELGEKINITYSHLSRIENGKKSPNIELLESLANFFDVEVAYFFGAKTQEDTEIQPSLEEKEWIAFKDESEKRGLTLEELRQVAEFIYNQRKK